MIDPPHIIGPRLRRIRIALGVGKQAEFAASIGVEKNTYNPWEKGSRSLTFSGACLIRDHHKIPLDYLFYGASIDELPSSIRKKLHPQAA